MIEEEAFVFGNPPAAKQGHLNDTIPSPSPLNNQPIAQLREMSRLPN